jgi:hypothetical protein
LFHILAASKAVVTPYVFCSELHFLIFAAVDASICLAAGKIAPYIRPRTALKNAAQT